MASHRRKTSAFLASAFMPLLYTLALLLLVFVVLPLTVTTPPTLLRALPEEHPPHRCPATKSPPVYVFLHLHKTAGNTLKRALFSFARRNKLSLHHTCHPAVPDTPFTAWWLNRRKAPAALDCNLDSLSSLPRPALRNISFVVGHQHHGAHTLFPHRPVRYFTVLRHPLHRKISHFYHFESRNSSLAHYLLSSNLNYMTKRLATRAPASEISLHFRARAIDIDAFAARAALSAAREHLARNFFFVGLHERFPESVCVLASILNRACMTGRRKHSLVSPQLMAYLRAQVPEGRKAHEGFGTGAQREIEKGLDAATTERERKRRVGRLAWRFLFPHRFALRSKDNVRGRVDDALSTLSKRVVDKALRAEATDVQLYRFGQTLFEQKLGEYPRCVGVSDADEVMRAVQANLGER